VKDNAIKKALVYVAVDVYERHAFEEGMDAKSDDKTCDGMDSTCVAMSGVGMMGVVMFSGFAFFFTARTMVMAVFSATCELLEE
jgi:hypothetical protein